VGRRGGNSDSCNRRLWFRWQLKNRDDAIEQYLDRIAEGWRQSGIVVSTGVPGRVFHGASVPMLLLGADDANAVED
jgi:hypothetical protein